jgi:hypothetical protein
MTVEPVLDQNAVTFYADGICTIIKVGSVTHLVFTSRQPQVSEAGRIYRIVEARMIVPNECLYEIGRAILAGRPVTPQQSEIDGFERPLN